MAFDPGNRRLDPTGGSITPVSVVEARERRWHTPRLGDDQTPEVVEPARRRPALQPSARDGDQALFQHQRITCLTTPGIITATRQRLGVHPAASRLAIPRNRVLSASQAPYREARP